MKGIAFGLCAGLIAASAAAQLRTDYNYADPEQWQGGMRETPLPAFPRPENLVEFYVSAIASNHFFIDVTSLSVSSDGVVGYTLVVKTAGGATNISFEGIRCRTGEYRIIATGRNDGILVRTRADDWRRIENKPMNRHHAALVRDFFCPDGIPLADAAKGVDALRRGKHPRAQ